MIFGPSVSKIKEIKFHQKIKEISTDKPLKVTKRAHYKMRTNFKKISLLYK